MYESFIERIQQWKHKATHDLAKSWWGLILLFLIALFEHRILEFTNHFIDAYIQAPNLRPIVFALAVLLFGVLAIVIHAYWQTRPGHALPAARPKIVPVRWGRTLGRQSGLIVRNDGEPAFDIVADEPIQIGKAKLDFWHRTYPQLTKGEGELQLEVCITLQQGSITDASALRDLMVKEDLSSLPFAIRYRGLDERPSFATKFDVIREVWGEGLRIGNVRQERG